MRKELFPYFSRAFFYSTGLGTGVLSSYLEEKANAILEMQLDENHYDEHQLISIKVPVDYLPYYNNSQLFERVDGEIEIDGVHYKYVKRRIYNDSLEMLCIPNTAVTALRSAQNEFFKFVNDLQRTGTDKGTHPHHSASKSFSADFFPAKDPFKWNDLLIPVPKIFGYYLLTPTSRHDFTEEHPPQSRG